MYPWLSWNSFCERCWPQTQRFTSQVYGVFCFVSLDSSADSKKDGLLYTSCSWPQVRTELVQNTIGPGQRASGTVVMTAVSLSISASKWRGCSSEETYSDSSTIQLVPASQVSSIPYLCSFGLRGCTGYLLGSLPHLFFSWASACALYSSSTLLSQCRSFYSKREKNYS